LQIRGNCIKCEEIYNSLLLYSF